MSDIAFDPPEGLPDISQMAFWVAPRDERTEAFRTLRNTPGLPKYPERFLEGSPFPPGPGYHAITRYEDVWAASRNPELFCSGQGSNIVDLPQELKKSELNPEKCAFHLQSKGVNCQMVLNH